MSERDTRPLYSPMPDRLAVIYDRHGPAIAELVLKVVHEAMEAGANSPPAERENDALSLASQVLSMGIFGLVYQMAEAKHVPAELVIGVVLGDVAHRTRFNLELLRTADQAKGAVKQ